MPKRCVVAKTKTSFDGCVSLGALPHTPWNIPLNVVKGCQLPILAVLLTRYSGQGPIILKVL